MKMKDMRFTRKRHTARGFTLVELLLVLVILALIGGLVLPGIIGKAEGAKVKAAGSQINRLAMAVESFYLDTGTTPDSLSDLVGESSDVDGWNG
ncbi:MAG: type II secretion system protein GspG, partial [Xanthomonadales bacterium]|nr:type II secretion system protein GspG [Xanthomonadales bacterium]